MTAPRHDSSRRVTPALLDYHKANAQRLRRQARRAAVRSLVALMLRLLRRRER